LSEDISKETIEKIISIAVASAASILCAIIDSILKDNEP
jgi:hypothetical protein